MVGILVAILLSVVGVACLYASWCKLVPKSIAAVGWLLLALSCGFWIGSAGGEFGIPLFFLGVGGCAWLAVGIHYGFLYDGGKRRNKEQPTVQAVIPDGHNFRQNLILFLVAVPFAGAVSLFCSVAIASVLPMTDVNALATGILLMFFMWSLAIYWVCADPKLFRPTLVLTLVGVISAGYIYL